jgi:hypothetical protein
MYSNPNKMIVRKQVESVNFGYVFVAFVLFHFSAAVHVVSKPHLPRFMLFPSLKVSLSLPLSFSIIVVVIDKKIDSIQTMMSDHGVYVR